jgi:hypothetical protein
VAGDKGDRAAELRTWLQAQEITAVLPDREDESGPHEDERALDRE